MPNPPRARGSILPFPRFVKPEQLDIGDLIRITYDPDNTGITATRQGTIARREYVGSERVLYTREGGCLLTWHPEHKSPRITLLAKAEQPQTMLDLFAVEAERA